jgi:hypothetical protein
MRSMLMGFLVEAEGLLAVQSVGDDGFAGALNGCRDMSPICYFRHLTRGLGPPRLA